jgi:hypothetical protein
LVRDAERLAKQEGRTTTDIVRQALRLYAEEGHWRRLQRYGAGRAKLGLKEADVQIAIQVFRRGRSVPRPRATSSRISC